MSALHYGRIQAALAPDGRLVYTAAAEQRSVPGWDRMAAPVFIPAQRRSSDDEPVAVGATADGTVVFYDPVAQPGIRRLGPAADDLQDLREYTRIPRLSDFAWELIGDNTAEETL